MFLSVAASKSNSQGKVLPPLELPCTEVVVVMGGMHEEEGECSERHQEE